MNLYSSNRLPYIVIIYLWEHLSDGLLYSKHNPLKIGRGEPGTNKMNSTHLSTGTASSNRKAVEDSSKNVTNYMKTIINMWNKITQADAPSSVTTSHSSEDTMNVDELYKLMDQQKSHVQFLKEIDALTDEDKKDKMQKTKRINNLIIGRASITIKNNSINVSN